MAGGGPEFGSSSGRKTLNAEVNLVPFIDLLSVCICFLLMTAVWVQIGSLDVKQTFGQSSTVAPDAYEIDFRFTGPREAQLVLKKGGKAEKPIALRAESPEALRAALGTQVDTIVEKRGVPASAILTAHQDVNHGEMIAVMDLFRKHKILSLGISAGTGI